jgi:hypothetical protein
MTRNLKRRRKMCLIPIAKCCPKCYQVFSLKYEKCPNCNCLLVTIFDRNRCEEEIEVRFDCEDDPIKIPSPCAKCGEMVTIRDYEKGNLYIVRGTETLAHQTCPKEVDDGKAREPPRPL